MGKTQEKQKPPVLEYRGPKKAGLIPPTTGIILPQPSHGVNLPAGIISELEGLNTSSLDKLESALSYARRGWPVFPLHTPCKNGACSCRLGGECANIGKHPRILKWSKDATTDEAEIRRWWRMWPDANIGVLTGKDSGFYALDIDPRHGGDISLAGLEVKHGRLPDTPMSLTGGGGNHFLFKHPGFYVKNRTGKSAILPGVDIKGDGGYIVAPPSFHEEGRYYAWDLSSDPADIPLVDAPGWLTDKIKPKEDKRAEPGKLPHTSPIVPNSSHAQVEKCSKYLIPCYTMPLVDGEPEPIYKGTRDETLFKLGCKLRSKGASFEEILQALTEVNDTRCIPPMEQSEVRKKAESAAKYEPSALTYRPSVKTDANTTDRGEPCTVYNGHSILCMVDPGTLTGDALRQAFMLPDVLPDICSVLGIPSDAGVNIGSSFPCVLPGHSDAETGECSASLYSVDDGTILYRDWHKESGKEWYFLPEVYACQCRGKVIRVGKSEYVTWAIRLLVDAGLLRPAHVPAPQIPDGAPKLIKDVYGKFLHLLACKWIHHKNPGTETPFTRSFAAAWCGIGEDSARLAVNALRDAGYIKLVGEMHSGRPSNTKLYLPGDDPRPWMLLVKRESDEEGD